APSTSMSRQRRDCAPTLPDAGRSRESERADEARRARAEPRTRERAAGAPLARLTLSMTDGLASDVLAGCAQTRCTKVDDIHLASCTTPGSVIVPTALALAAAGDLRSVGDVCAAALAGFETLIRYGVAING